MLFYLTTIKYQFRTLIIINLRNSDDRQVCSSSNHRNALCIAGLFFQGADESQEYSQSINSRSSLSGLGLDEPDKASGEMCYSNI